MGIDLHPGLRKPEYTSGRARRSRGLIARRVAGHVYAVTVFVGDGIREMAGAGRYSPKVVLPDLRWAFLGRHRTLDNPRQGQRPAGSSDAGWPDASNASGRPLQVEDATRSHRRAGLRIARRGLQASALEGRRVRRKRS